MRMCRRLEVRGRVGLVGEGEGTVDLGGEGEAAVVVAVGEGHRPRHLRMHRLDRRTREGRARIGGEGDGAGTGDTIRTSVERVGWIGDEI